MVGHRIDPLTTILCTSAVHQARDGRSSSSYGLSFILASVTLSNEQLRDEALAERDMTKEQYEQLQSLQKMQTVGEVGAALTGPAPGGTWSSRLARRVFLSMHFTSDVVIFVHAA